MIEAPESVAAFLRGRRFAVAGVSRQSSEAANAVFRKLRSAGYEVFPINPNASEVEGTACYSEVGVVPGQLDGVVIDFGHRCMRWWLQRQGRVPK
jgi:predicted CoA-binding protein